MMCYQEIVHMIVLIELDNIVIRQGKFENEQKVEQ